METKRESEVEIEREYGPFEGRSAHGVAFDGTRVWVALGDDLRAFDPKTGAVERSLDVPADAGTTFDGRYLYQLTGATIQKVDPENGSVVATIAAPGRGGDAGMAWAEGKLWVGQYRERKIHCIDPETGRIERTIESDRFVTGVTFVDEEMWHATWDGERAELRRVDPPTGEVRERHALDPGVFVSGLAGDGERFYCGAGSEGKVRAVKPRRVR